MKVKEILSPARLQMIRIFIPASFESFGTHKDYSEKYIKFDST